MAATPFEMSRVPAAAKRDVAVTEASAAWSDRDSADADALPGVLTSLMPNVCISWETPPAAVANPTPRQPASTHDAQARPTIFSASPPVRYALRFFKQNLSLAAHDQTAKAATACFRLSKGLLPEGRYAVLTGIILPEGPKPAKSCGGALHRLFD